jgi:hypothetical protein
VNRDRLRSFRTRNAWNGQPGSNVFHRFNAAVKGNLRRGGEGALGGNPMVGTVEDIRVWRLRAEELRVLAGTMEDAAARLGVLHAARNYDQMAANAEGRLKSDPVVLELPTLLPA